MKLKHLKQEVLNTFRELIGKNFTVGQAINVYMTSPSCIHTEIKSARQFIYRNILRLIETGELEKTSGMGARQKYRLTEQFKIRLGSVQSSMLSEQVESKVPKADPNKNLTERLNHQKLELLTTMGEAEEYDAIYKEMPEMQEQIQSLYNDSRDRCSKLLGKVKALENLISLSTR